MEQQLAKKILDEKRDGFHTLQLYMQTNKMNITKSLSSR